jgi:disulfide bond formation protein DsbB
LTRPLLRAIVIRGRSPTWYATATALVVACVATAGSLFYSEVWGLYPCRLCWYQRILMYPLVVVLGVAALYPGQDHAVGRFVLPLSVPGAALALYHSALQAGPSLQCSIGGCGTVQFRLLGLLSIPNQALLGFALISLLVGYVAVRRGVLSSLVGRFGRSRADE